MRTHNVYPSIETKYMESNFVTNDQMNSVILVILSFLINKMTLHKGFIKNECYFISPFYPLSFRYNIFANGGQIYRFSFSVYIKN